jgi:hypothetical protein
VSESVPLPFPSHRGLKLVPGRTEKGQRHAARTIGVMHQRHGAAIDGRPCGSCEHFTRYMAGNSDVMKCRRFGTSSSRATDWRATWPGCGLWQPAAVRLARPARAR